MSDDPELPDHVKAIRNRPAPTGATPDDADTWLDIPDDVRNQMIQQAHRFSQSPPTDYGELGKSYVEAMVLGYRLAKGQDDG